MNQITTAPGYSEGLSTYHLMAGKCTQDAYDAFHNQRQLNILNKLQQDYAKTPTKKLLTDIVIYKHKLNVPFTSVEEKQTFNKFVKSFN